MSTSTDFPQGMVNQQPWLQLYGQIEEDGQADATMMVRWCVPLSRELSEILKTEGIIKPYVLVVVRPFAYEETPEGTVKRYQGESLRKLVPLTDEATYISFSRPGHNEVLACIVGSKDGYGKHELGGVFTYGDPFAYWTDSRIFEYDGELIPGDHHRWTGKIRYEGYIVPDSADTLPVDVPAEMFAPEYPKWRTELVGKFHRSKTKDECNMFWRTLRSFFYSLGYFPVAYLARLVQLVICLWLGMRGISVSGFLHPIQYGFDDVSRDTTTSFWFMNKNRKERPFVLWPLNPVTPVISGLILWIIGTFHMTKHEHVVGVIGWVWWKYFVVTALVHVGIFAVFLVLMALFGLVSFIIGTSLSNKLASRISARRQSTKKARAKAAEQRKLEAQKALDRELAVMACSDTSRKVSLDALPKQKQTLRLRVAHKKSKSCKPFAR